MDKYHILKENIRNSNLSDLDKQTLIGKLSEDTVDINELILAFLRILQIASIISKAFDIDIGD
jgi:hypothetical protein